MKISKQELLQQAATAKFRPEILEKVWHLISLLNAIYNHAFLSDKLVLKGGTALNLFYFNLARLSVDIDLNYIGKLETEAMLLERPLVEQALEAVFREEGMIILRIPEKHAGGKWRLKYGSALGGYGNLEVDLNFMFRLPLYDIKRMRSVPIGTHQTQEISILDLYELGAGKLSALFNRQASRDLFDAHELLTKTSINFEELRFSCLLYGAMGSRDWREVSVDEISFDEKEFQNQLIPVLPKTAKSDWAAWGQEMLEGCKKALLKIFPLRENEKEFLDKFYKYAILDCDLLTKDSYRIEKIISHPLLKWKQKLIIKNNTSSA